MKDSIRNTAQLNELIAASKGLILYFYSDDCAPCISLRPKVKAMVDEFFPLLQLEFIDSMKYPELPAVLAVFSSPSLLVFFEGKEFVRESKYVSIESLQEKIERYYAMVFGV
ncbi:MAG TPA: thioredoxin family protein [Bacteroidales bacterium]